MDFREYAISAGNPFEPPAAEVRLPLDRDAYAGLLASLRAAAGGPR